MCGIVGFIGNGDQSDLEGMLQASEHRGPDGSGQYIDEVNSIYIGHRRLAIRDIAGGAQPMWDTHREICVTYNGEIYNHRLLREELTQRGYVFQTSHSDTEVLVHGYKEWGAGLAEKLNGMFAFAVLDIPRSRLFLARDRFGEKPLYYGKKKSLFAFASELSALSAHKSISTNISDKAAQKLFGYGFIPAPNALYEDTWKLPGGHYMWVNLKDLSISIEPYWQFSIDPDDAIAARTDEDIAEELRHLIISSTNDRLVSDVPVGIFLSGGVDSSAVLAAAAQQRDPKSLETFTIGFQEKSYDESSFAKQVADYIGSKHHNEILTMDRCEELVPQILTQLDEPLGDASLVPTYLLSAFTRKSVTVALSGDGGDELFAGYDPFKALAPAAFYSRIVPSKLHSCFRSAVSLLPHSPKNMSLDFKLRRTLSGLSQPESAWAPAWMAPLDYENAADLFEKPLTSDEVYSEAIDLWETGSAKTRTDRLLQYFTHLYLQDDILTKVDRASMMSSLETRAIFLDNEIVDFCARLPHHYKMRNGNRKYILKKALAPLLPRNIIHRRKKGFGIPLATWMRHVPTAIPLRPIAGMRLDWAHRAWSDHRSQKADHRLFMWTWLSLQSTASVKTVQ